MLQYTKYSQYIVHKQLQDLNLIQSDKLFCGMVDRRKKFSLISSPDQCQMSSPSQVSDMPRAELEPAQNLSSRIVEWSCAVAVTSTPRHLTLFLQVIVSMICIVLLFLDILKYLHMCLHKVLYTLLFTKNTFIPTVTSDQ